MRVAYIYGHCAWQMFALGLAVYTTVIGLYGWSVFLIILCIADGHVFGKRMDLWTGEINKAVKAQEGEHKENE